uniref:Partner and localiser of BRCA2 WD40 domain-containing protein n=1 Tax=Anolis carolinensis TaxID=28377 RepID=H9GIF4_ANOCA
ENQSEQEPQASHFFKEEPPTKTLQEKHIEGPLDLDSSLQEEEVPPTALSFCTMVEGLLFPVEYYVRTTRRMSSRQTEVNVEAVIQSQLGRSRKGQKVSRKAVLSSQKAAEIPGQPNTNNRVLSPAVSSNGGLAERLLGDAVQEHLGSTHPRNASGWAFPCAIFPFLFTERSGCLPVSPIRLSLASSVLPLCNQSSAASLLQWLPPSIPALKDFCLPEDEFGLLKSEKIKACAAVTAAKGLAAKAEGSTAGEHLSDTSISATPEVSAASPLASHLAPRRLSSDLLLSPVLEASSGPLLSSLPSPAFPFLGATPASPSFPASQAFCASPSQGRPGTKGEASSPFPRSGTKGQRRTSLPAEEEEEEVLTCVICKSLEIQGSFLFFSPCPGQSCAGPSSSFVDVSTVWWEVDGFTALCVVTASEGSVSLWRPLDSGHWALIHTWHFTKVGAVHAGRIIRVGRDHMAWFCVALAILEIAEIRLLFHSGEGVSVKQSVVKAGNIKAVLGLRKRRLVTSCGSVREQEVEVASFSEMGRSIEKRALKPPEETLLAFAEVDGMEEALVGMTTTNSLVIWNLTSGQLLTKMPIGCSFPASVCHRAYADEGLLFVVLSHPRAKDCQAEKVPAFRIVALNPKTARSATVTAVSVPQGSGGRFLEGEVRDASAAAAVLTSGAIAVWDLLLGRCTALLAPRPEGRWSLVRWSAADGCLLAGKDDGSLFHYKWVI